MPSGAISDGVCHCLIVSYHNLFNDMFIPGLGETAKSYVRCIKQLPIFF